MLSNDNRDGDERLTMEVSEDVTMTPIVKQATTPVAFPHPLVLSKNNDSASGKSKMSEKMANMASKYDSPRIDEVFEESK